MSAISAHLSFLDVSLPGPSPKDGFLTESPLRDTRVSMGLKMMRFHYERHYKDRPCFLILHLSSIMWLVAIL